MKVKFSKELKQFISDVKKSGGHVLDIVNSYNGKKLVYYRNYESLVTNVKTKVI